MLIDVTYLELFLKSALFLLANLGSYNWWISQEIVTYKSQRMLGEKNHVNPTTYFGL
jgi:hypothetical protein